MFHNLKSFIIKKTLEKRKSENTFDCKTADEYVLPDNAAPVLNNTHAFIAHGADGEALSCRLTHRSACSEIWFSYVKNDNKYLHNSLICSDNLPLKIEKRGVEWRVQFDGEVEGDNGEILKAVFDGYFVSDCHAVDFCSDMPTEKLASAFAYEGFFKNRLSKIRENRSTHYEQLGKLFGRLTIDGSEITLDMPSVRQHSFGELDVGSFNNHFRLLALKGKSQLSFLLLSHKKLTALELGNFISAEQKMFSVIAADYDRAIISRGSAPAYCELSLLLDDGRRVSVKAKTRSVSERPLSEGLYTVYECAADFEIDGEKYSGSIELGFNREPTRWFNGRKLGELKL